MISSGILTVRKPAQRNVFTISLVFFVTSYTILLLGMPRWPVPYDEGLMLTAVMRIMAGQVPHRDFYAIYGPANFYVPAALFKMFGQNLLVNRLLGFFVEALTTAVTYAIASRYCRRSISIAAAIVTILWFEGWNSYSFYPVFPVALLSIVSTALLVPSFARRLAKKRLFAAGALAGLSTLFRYDMGAGLLAVHICFLAIASYSQPSGPSKKITIFFSDIWPYLLGFSILTLPLAIYFLSVSAFYPMLRDVVILQYHNYYRGRNTPFPGLHLKYLDDLAVYLPIVTVVLSLFALRTAALAGDRDNSGDLHPESEERERKGLVIAFSLLAFAMFFKSYVRIGALPMFTSLLPCLLMTAVLFEYREKLPNFARITTNLLAACFLFTAALSSAKSIRRVIIQGNIPGRIARVLSSRVRPAGDFEASWCAQSNPMTKGFCFWSDEGRLRTIEFIDSHTQPSQRLFVGVTRHDKIFANDNIIYFTSQRLPATKWSHFDPDLQNSYPIQLEMVHELDETSPPYIVLDSEFDSIHEANDSSKSTGVTLLDDYIHSRYRYAQAFDEMSIWERIP